MLKIIRGIVCLSIFVLALPTLAQVDPDAVTIFPMEGRQFYTELSPDDRTVAIWQNEIIVGNDPAPAYRVIQLLDIETGDVRELTGGTDYTRDVAFTSDGAIMASIHPNGDVNIWNIADGTLINAIPLVMSVGIGQFLADNQTLVVVTSGLTQQFLYLDITSGAITRIVGKRFDTLYDYRENYSRPPANFELIFSAFVVNGAGSELYAANANGDILMWADDPTQETVLFAAPEDQMGTLAVRSLVLTDDGRSVIYYVRGDNQIVRFGQTAAIPNGSSWFAVAPDDNRVAWIDTETNTVKLSSFDDPETVETLYTLPENLSGRGTGVQMAFTSDGNRLVMGGFASSDLQNAIIVIDLAA